MIKKKDEVIVEELAAGDEDRTVRVYDSKGDFVVTLPAGCRMTFGYFNPGQSNDPGDAFAARRPQELRRTALRIYKGSGQGNQLACFLGVNGFRDQSIKLTRLTTRVVLETNLDDDGEGNLSFAGKQQKQLVASPEPDTYS